LDYKLNYPFENRLEKEYDDLTEDELIQVQEKRASVHQRAADRVLGLFQRNGGIYIKLGQHMAALEHILPLEYSKTLSILQNQAPTSSLDDVAAVIREDLGGRAIEEVFSEFDTVPLGAASLAQVHRAKLKENDQEVAVKVQHHRLQAHVDMDLVTVSAAVKIIRRIFPQFEFNWLADEMKTNLPKELDFTAEGHNSERLVHNLNRTWPSNCPVYIPKVFWNYSSKRILVMEYCAGSKITDLNWMKQNKVDPRKVSRDLTSLYAQMIFLHGFVHCDPHPGNIFLQFDRHSPNKYKIVLLDHGLYKEFPNSFRLSYAKLWKALIDGNESSIRKYSQDLGGGAAYKLFSVVLTHRSWESMISARDWDRPRNPIDVVKFRDRATEYLPIVADLLSKLPRPLLLLLKTNDLLRAIDRTLHLDNPKAPSDTFLIMGKYCVFAINEDRWRSAQKNPVSEILVILRNLLSSISMLWKSICFDIYRVILQIKS